MFLQPARILAIDLLQIRLYHQSRVELKETNKKVKLVFLHQEGFCPHITNPFRLAILTLPSSSFNHWLLFHMLFALFSLKIIQHNTHVSTSLKASVGPICLSEVYQYINS